MHFFILPIIAGTSPIITLLKNTSLTIAPAATIQPSRMSAPSKKATLVPI